MSVSYRLKIEEVEHPSPGEPADARYVTHDKEHETLEAVREVLEAELPVSLDSGEPMHYDTGDGDEFDIGRVYHYWSEVICDHEWVNVWVDAWVSVDRIEHERVKWDTVMEAEK